MSKKQAQAFKVKVEHLNGANITGVMDDEVARWVAELDDVMHGKLAAVGLVNPRTRQTATLKGFLDDFFKSLNVKPGTAVAYGHTRECLLAFFGETKPIREIEPADAEQFRQYLKTSARRQVNVTKLSTSTIARRVGVARQMFRVAVRWKLIAENPFADVKGGVQTNKERMYFVSREETQKVIDACPDAQWKLLFALSRFGGLRCPSEHLALTWQDIDWENKTIRVTSPKTEHHAGKDFRIIPLFPELKPYLLNVFEQADEGSKYVITRYRSSNANLRTHLLRIIRRAGVKPWPKLFHNLRSSRQTELAEEYPIHVVCAWMGNSRAVAQGHYLQITDEHIRRATAEPDASKDAKAAQKAAQSAAVRRGKGRDLVSPENENRSGLPSDSDVSRNVRDVLVGAEGFEPSKA